MPNNVLDLQPVEDSLDLQPINNGLDLQPVVEPLSIPKKIGEVAKGAARGGVNIAQGINDLVSFIGDNLPESTADLGAAAVALGTGSPIAGANIRSFLRRKSSDDVIQSVGDRLSKFGAENSEFWQNVQQKSFFAPDPTLFRGTFMQNPSWTRGAALIAEAVPSLGAAAAITIATRSPTAGAAMLGTTEAAGQYKEAKGAGAGQGKANVVFATSAIGNTLLEKIPLEYFFKGIGNRAVKAGVGGLLEGVQEGTQTVYSNLIAKIGYDRTRKLHEGVVESFIAGSGSGAAIGALTPGNAKKLDEAIESAIEDGVTPQEIEQAQQETAEAIVENADVIDEILNIQDVEKVEPGRKMGDLVTDEQGKPIEVGGQEAVVTPEPVAEPVDLPAGESKVTISEQEVEPQQVESPEPSPSPSPEEAVNPLIEEAKKYKTVEEFSKSIRLIDDVPAGDQRNDKPFSGKFEEGKLYKDSFGEDPYIYRSAYVNPKDFIDKLNLEGKTYQQVLDMPTTQKYINWYKEGHLPPPIGVVKSLESGKNVSTNRRRIVAAIEAGINKIPATVEIGRVNDIYAKAHAKEAVNPEQGTSTEKQLKRPGRSFPKEQRVFTDDEKKIIDTLTGELFSPNTGKLILNAEGEVVDRMPSERIFDFLRFRPRDKGESRADYDKEKNAAGLSTRQLSAAFKNVLEGKPLTNNQTEKVNTILEAAKIHDAFRKDIEDATKDLSESETAEVIRDIEKEEPISKQIFTFDEDDEGGGSVPKELEESLKDVVVSPQSKELPFNWREGFKKADIYEKSDILRAVAEVSKSEKELVDILNKIPEVKTEQSNILWAVAHNPYSSENTKKKALDSYNKLNNISISSTSIPKVPPVTPKDTPSTPDKGKVRGLSKSIEEQAIKEGLVEDLGELPTYKTRNMDEIAQKVSDFISKDYELAKKIAFGEAPEQGDIRAQEIFTGLRIKAVMEGDVDTIQELATNPHATALATELGQRIKALDTSEPGDPVKAIREVVKASEEANKGKPESAERTQQAAEIEALKKRLDEVEQTLKRYREQAEKAPGGKERKSKKAFGSTNKVFTQEVADAAREALRKKFSGLHAGVDPTAVADLTKLGGFYFEGGLRSFGEWSSALVSEFGDKVKPYLSAAFKNVQQEFKDYQVNEAKDKLKASAEEGKTIADVSYLAQQIAEILIDSGTVKTGNVLKEVHGILKDIFPNITIRESADAISGYGKYKRLNPAETKKILREIKGELQQVSKLEDMLEGQAPLKTGVERRAVTDEERLLIKMVEEAKRKYGFKITDSETQLKSSLEAYKTRLKNSIKDLETQISERRKIIKEKTPIHLDKEAQDLIAKKDELRKQFIQIFGRQGISLEQRINMAEKSLSKSIEEYERRLKESDTSSITKQGKPVSTPKVNALRAKRDALRAVYQDFKKSLKPKKSVQEIKLQSLKTRLENEAKRLENRLENLDFSSQEKVELKLDLKAQRLRAEYEQKKAAYNAAKAVKEVVTKKEVKEIVRLSKNLAEKKAAVDRTSPDFSESRIAHSTAAVDFRRYVGQLKAKAAHKPFLRMLRESPGKVLLDAFGISKVLKSFADDSVIGRQGNSLFFSHPKIWAKHSIDTFSNIFKVFRGEDVMRAIDIRNFARENSINGLDKKEKLAIGSVEDDYPVNILENIPFMGRVFKASEAAFVGFLHSSRADVFDKYVNIAKKTGGNTDGLGAVVNSLLGRGGLGKAEAVGDKFNLIFYSARFVVGNFNVLTAHVFDKNVGSFAKKQAALNLLKIIVGTALIKAIAYLIDPDSVENDPRSSDFSKIKIGNSRFDITGGKGPMITLAARIFPLLIGQPGYAKSTTTGIVTPLNSGKFGARTGLDVLEDFIQGKGSPGTTTILNMLKGKDFKGNELTPANIAKGLVVPIIYENYEELKDDEESANMVLALIADGLGIGVNTYSPGRNFEAADSKEMKGFKEQVGEKKFKEANQYYNKEYSNRINTFMKTDFYKKKTDEQKLELLKEEARIIKKRTFSKYGFTP